MAFLSVKSLIGEGYDESWFTNCHDRIRIFVGARNTKKSHNILGVEPIIKILSDDRRNIIMLRQNDVDNPDSTYANLVQRINEMGLSHIFSCIKSPYKIIRKSTGQVILFRGLNHEESIKSVKPVVGYFTDVYIEEASEVENYESFRMLDGSIRGKLPEGLFFQITLALNPSDVEGWIYEKFFKDRFEPSENILLDRGYDIYCDHDFNLGFGKGLFIHTSSYKINEFRDPEYDIGAEKIKEVSYEIYKTDFLGMFGSGGDKCYPCYTDSLIIPNFRANTYTYTDFAIGVDVGLSDGQGRVIKKGEIRSATAMTIGGLNTEGKLIVMDEYFFSNTMVAKKKTEAEIQDDLLKKLRYWIELYPWMLNRPIHIFVDHADIGFRQSLQDAANKCGMGYLKCLPCTKLPIHNRISFTNHLMAFGELLISENCKNLIREFKTTHRNEKKGIMRDSNDHAIDSLDYLSVPLWGKMRRWASFKFTK